MRVYATYYDKRDQFGHWVRPASAAGKPCPHKCCQGHRVHPQNLPVKLDRAYLRSLTDEQAYRELEQYQRYSDSHEEGFLQVLAELNRREESHERAQARHARARDKRQRANEEYRDEVYRQWLTAESATNGYMLNKEGQRRGIDERSLFTGPQSRVNKYASDELKEWFLTHPRMTRAEYDQQRRREQHEERRAYRRAA